jgi:MinD-like ATPase involved in chromosome partitioning or flagellar assembly
MSSAESDTGSALPKWVVDPSSTHDIGDDPARRSSEKPLAMDRQAPQVETDSRRRSDTTRPDLSRETRTATFLAQENAPNIAHQYAPIVASEDVSETASASASSYATEDGDSAVRQAQAQTVGAAGSTADLTDPSGHRSSQTVQSHHRLSTPSLQSESDRTSPRRSESAAVISGSTSDERRSRTAQVDANVPPSRTTGSTASPFTSQPIRFSEPGVQQAIPAMPVSVEPPRSIDDIELIRRAQLPPSKGWRRILHRLSCGSVNPGQSPAEIEYDQLIRRVRQPVRGNYKIAVLSMKGGVGKTTTTTGLGSTFAAHRGDRVIAYDANPDFGTLAYRIHRDSERTVRDLLTDKAVHSYSDVRIYTSQAKSRLEVLASERDPSVSEAFNEHDYTAALRILECFYNIILTDCGTGLMNSAMAGALKEADALVLVSSAAKDGARSAGATLEWLSRHGFDDLVKRTVVVINESRKGSSALDVEQLKSYFSERTRAVQVVPYDDHLAEGDTIDLDLLGKLARRAFVELAALLADDFPPNIPRTTPQSGPTPW